MSAPPWVFSCLISIAVAWSSDRHQEKVSLHRSYAIEWTLLMFGFSSGTLSAQFAWVWSVLSSALRPRTQLVAMLHCSFKLAHTLGKFGYVPCSAILINTQSSFIVFYSWISSSFPRPPAKRAVAIAMINAFSQIGNIAGSYVWFDEANDYRASYGITTAMFGVTIVGCYGFKFMLSRLNKELERQETLDETQPDAVDTGDEKLQLSKGFRYLT